ncbi:hypothetical protein PtA15_2A704 [Puccinia triticina]|uniref:F-box domain-containing protein n=1 Tax=Puccinia triticina TaxID=208348 RepID=A0ABY7CD53_9BASI|nr:uncharacterized protein PtA15_2A704 [Puccinia triticina]WAQ82387.1 hypothetical protein PtA15_2A704 [Puccinia triticina]
MAHPGRAAFAALSLPSRAHFLSALLPSLNLNELTSLSARILPRLKRDFLRELPIEISLHILSFVDDPKTLMRAGMVSRFWRSLVSDEATWKGMCSRRGFSNSAAQPASLAERMEKERKGRVATYRAGSTSCCIPDHPDSALWTPASLAQNELPLSASSFYDDFDYSPRTPFSYKSYFKRAYLTESNWLRGPGELVAMQTSQNNDGHEGVVTSLGFDDDWIVVGMATSKIHVFNAHTGEFARTLTGHELGVWCLALVSKGGIRDPRDPLPEDIKGKRAESHVEREEQHYSASYPQPESTHGLFTTPEEGEEEEHQSPSSSANLPTTEWVSSAYHPSSYATNMMRGHGGLGMNSWTRDRHGSQDTTVRGYTLPATDMSSIFQPASANMAHDEPAAPVPMAATQEWPGTHEPQQPLAAQASACGIARGWGQKASLVVSGGCDRDVRVWDVMTGRCKYVLHGHSSTIRCLKVLDGRPLAVSGSRDSSLRVWDIERGEQKHVLVGHTSSVRAIEVHGNRAVSGSYDTTCRLWDVDSGECLKVLRGHYHQIYAVAFDGIRIASGSMDSTVCIWSASTGELMALLQGHTALVGQVQINGQSNVLVTGGSDGRVVIFSLDSFECLHRLCAHDNSVTCLQFDDRFVVTGGNDGRVKLWDFKTGSFIRELAEPCEAVWRITLRDDKAVLFCKRDGKTVMEVISFRPSLD